MHCYTVTNCITRGIAVGLEEEAAYVRVGEERVNLTLRYMTQIEKLAEATVDKLLRAHPTIAETLYQQNLAQLFDGGLRITDVSLTPSDEIDVKTSPSRDALVFVQLRRRRGSTVHITGRGFAEHVTEEGYVTPLYDQFPTPGITLLKQSNDDYLIRMLPGSGIRIARRVKERDHPHPLITAHHYLWSGNTLSTFHTNHRQY